MERFLATIFGKTSLKSLISKDWLQKIVSVLLAVILWYFVGGEDKIDKIVMVPIEIINLPRDLVISNQFKKEIEVTVSGPRSLILDMANKSVTRQVDLSSATPGTMVIENDGAHIPVPRNVEVQRVQPSSIILSLDKLIQKQFPVNAKTVGSVPAGYSLVDLKIDPDVISITGPQTILSQVDDLETRPINLDGLKESAQLQIPLALEPAIVELIGETSVTADVKIAIDTITKTVEKVPVRVVVNGSIQDVIPPYAKVTLKVPKNILKEQPDVRKLFTLTASKREGIPGLQIRLLPKAGLEMPLEVVAMKPQVVFPVAEGDSSSEQTNSQDAAALNRDTAVPSKETANNNVDVEQEIEQGQIKHLVSEKNKKIIEQN